MKLHLKDLKSGITNQIFGFDKETLPHKGISFSSNKIKCNISSKKRHKSFNLSGKLYAETSYECVRCLSKQSFAHVLPINVNIVQHNYKNLFEASEEKELITFLENQEYIDLADVFTDIIALAQPMKPLCVTDCKGLCSLCGQNRNNSICSCSFPEQQTVWDELKKINIK
jgi:uncharacterized metal-binding protein YceD (DUF177 family)